MELPPKAAGCRKVFGGYATSDNALSALHTVDVYLDFACPYSAKMFTTLYYDVFTHLQTRFRPIQFIFRHQIQPWHPSSLLLHEAALAVLRLAPEKFWDFCMMLFKHQKDFFDVNVVNETRNDTYKVLAKLAATSTGLKDEDVYDLLKVSDKPDKDGNLNTGNQITDEVKQVVKRARLARVHVSPTVVFDGVIKDEISSSWDKDKWIEWLWDNAN
ncbi:Thioredoxin-like fold [Naviculisporaceae sp. PSN 640]